MKKGKRRAAGPPTCVCKIHGKGNYNIIALSIMILVQVLFLMLTVFGLIDKEFRSFLFLSLVWFGMMAWDFQRDLTYYRNAGHSTYCVFRQSMLNACYRYKGFPAPGDR